TLPSGSKPPWQEPVRAKRDPNDRLDLAQVARALANALTEAEREKVSFCTLARGWPTSIWPWRDPLSYLGKDGGGGIGSGPGISVGCALALERLQRYPIAVLGDGDFAMGASAIWTAARYRIPLLVIINNNKSYFNDELHQQLVANQRGRDPANRWI